jgi:hypothetical protein
MNHTQSAGRLAAAVALLALGLPAFAGPDPEAVRERIQKYAQDGDCLRAEAHLVKVRDDPSSVPMEPDDVAEAERQVLECWFDAQDWERVASFGLPRLQHSTSGWPHAEPMQRRRVLIYAGLAYGDADPTHALVERLGAPRHDPKPSTLLGPTPGLDTSHPEDRVYFQPTIPWPIERFLALAETDPQWLRDGVASCLETLEFYVGEIHRADLDPCVAALAPPPEVEAVERRIREEREAAEGDALTVARYTVDGAL